jgi:glycosyltransferase involved in cell wall biosynthesis
MNLRPDNSKGAPKPRVSVGMPVYNGEEFIGEAIRSILDQSFRNIELIICDNASADSTGDICRKFAAADNRVRYYANSVNIGVTDNYNRAFGYGRGEYFKWASGNDYCKKDFIARCIEVLDRRPDAVLCYPKTRVFDIDIAEAEDYEDNLDLQQEDPVSRFELLIDRVWLNNVMNGVVRADALKRTRPLKAFWSSDFNLLAELVLLGKFVEIPERLFYRRVNAQAHSSLQRESEILRRLWPNEKRALAFRTWRLHREYFATVYRAQLSYAEKCRLYLILVKRLKWKSEMLVRELTSAFK